MKKGLYLDDNRTPKDNKEIDWIIVRNYKQFVDWILANGLPDIISFDHDLADEHMQAFFENAGQNQQTVVYKYDTYKEKTGYDAAKWLCEYCLDNNLTLPLVITVHSANYKGAENILSYLYNYKKLRGEICKIYRSVW